MNTSVDTTVPIQELQERLRARLAYLEEQLKPMEAEASKIRKQLELLGNVLRAEEVIPVQDEDLEASRRADSSAVDAAVAESVFTILQDAGGPLHISDIRNKYIESGRTIPGKGNESNLLAYMLRDKRFVRTAKGTYGLAEQGFTAVQSSRRKKRRRARAAA